MNELTHYTEDKVRLLQQTLAKGSTPEEFEIFLHACKRTGLDPFVRQIWLVKRWDSNLKREAMTIQVSVDGLRAIADRTGRYSPGKAATFEYKEDGSLLSATAYVMKQTNDGHWHEVSTTVYWDEYAGKKKDGNLTPFWEKMGHTMLSKVAESHTLRKAFPMDMTGLYTPEEMTQSSNPKECSKPISPEEIEDLNIALDNCDDQYKEKVFSGLKSAYGIEHLGEIPREKYSKILKAVKENAIGECNDMDESL